MCNIISSKTLSDSLVRLFFLNFKSEKIIILRYTVTIYQQLWLIFLRCVLWKFLNLILGKFYDNLARNYWKPYNKWKLPRCIYKVNMYVLERPPSYQETKGAHCSPEKQFNFNKYICLWLYQKRKKNIISLLRIQWSFV